MNKNELVHLHALLSRVAEEYVAEGIATPDDFTAYTALGTTPMALRQSRNDHKVAATVLCRTLARLSTENVTDDSTDARTEVRIQN